MLKKILNLLILCGILCQGLPRTSAEADIGKPSDVLVRHKRVFYSNITSDVSMIRRESSYIVNIKIKHGSYETNHCVGSILMAHVFITAAQCATLNTEEYSIYSQSRFSHNGTRHSVIGKKIHISTTRQNAPYRNADGIALMIVYPHFTISPSSSTGAGYIALRHNRPIPPHAVGTVSGWGYGCSTLAVTEPIVALQSIIVRTLENEDCADRWRGAIQITPKDICTYDTKKHCGHSDIGAPLVVDRQLVGVHIISGGLTEGSHPRPDIFAYLDHPEYVQWVRANINTPTK